MARHVWDSKSYTPEILRLSRFTVEYLIHKDIEPDRIYCHIGYLMERRRQERHGDTYIPVYLLYERVEKYWSKLDKTGHRYSKGKNREISRQTQNVVKFDRI